MSVIRAVIRRDLFGRIRHPRFYLTRVSFVFLAGSLMLVMFRYALLTQASTAGLWSFSALCCFLLAVACFVAPWNAAATIAQEKEDRTLGLLLLSDVRPMQVVLGKMFSPAFATAAIVFSGLPLLILCAGQGGIDTPQVLGGIAIILATVFAGTCLGVAVSSMSPTIRVALGGVILGILLLFWGLPAVALWWSATYRPALGESILYVVSPFGALNHALAGHPISASLNCAFNLVVGIFFLGIACFAVPRLAREKEKGSVLKSVKRRYEVLTDGNPVAWKEQFSSFVPRMQWRLAGLAVATSLLAGYLLAGTRLAMAFSFEKPDDALFIGAGISGALSLLVVIIGAATIGVTAFSREKRTRSFELLLVSGLSDIEIVLGKLWHPIRTFMPWVIVLVVAGLIGSLAGTHGRPIDTALILMAIVSFVPALAGIALHASLCYRAGVAAAITAAGCIGGVVFLSIAAISGGVGSLSVILVNLAVLGGSISKMTHRLRQVSSGEKMW